jgi:hypothetical protein
MKENFFIKYLFLINLKIKNLKVNYQKNKDVVGHHIALSKSQQQANE